MALERDGVELVVEGLAAFQQGMRSARAGLDSIGEGAVAVGRRFLSGFGEIATGALRRVGELITDLGRRVLAEFGRNFMAGIQQASNVKELQAGWEAINTTWDRVGATLGAAVAPALTDVVNAILPLLPAVEQAAVDFGNLLGALTIVARDAAPGVQAALGAIGSAITSVLGPLPDDMNTWGFNIIMSFAQGMSDAIGAVIDVLANLASVIASWLMPGSPPRLLPDLDKWGADAMTVYLDGWKSADWSVFDELSGTIESFIRGLNIPQTDVVPRILGSREAIEAAVQQMHDLGSVSAESIQAIMQAIGTSDPAVQGYIESMIQMEAANRAVTDAQAALNAITQRYDAILAPLNAELDALNARETAMNEQRREAQLTRIINSRTASEAQKEQARIALRESQLRRQIRTTEAQKKAETDVAQQRLDAAKAAADLAAQQFAAAKAQIAATTENNRLLMEQMKLLERLAQQQGGGGAPGGKGGGGIKPPMPKPLGGLDPAKQAEWAASIEAAFARLAAPFAALQERLAGLAAAWAPIVEAAQSAFDQISAYVTPLMNIVAAAFNADVAEMSAFALREWGRIQQWTVQNWPLISQTITTASRVAQAAVGIMVGTIVSQILNMVTQAGIALRVFEGLVDAAMTYVLGTLRAAMQAINGDWGAAWTTATNTVLLFEAQIIETFVRLYNELIGHSLIPDIINGIVNLFTNTDWAALGRSIIDGIIGAINDGVGDLMNAAAQAAQSAFDAFMRALQGGSPSRLFARGGAWAVQGFINGVTAMTGRAERAMGKLAQDAYQAFADTAADTAQRMRLPPIPAPPIAGVGDPRFLGPAARGGGLPAPMPPVSVAGHRFLGPPSMGGNTITVNANYAGMQDPPTIIRDFNLAMAML